jgi:hypothetical protein
VTSPELRPLGMGEILDRAVTMFVRNFWLFVLVLAAVAIPVAVVAYFINFDFTQWLLAIERRAIPTVPAIATHVPGAQMTPLAALVSFVSLLVQMVSATACAVAAGAVYGSHAITPREAYRKAWPRMGAQLLTSCALIGISIAGLIAVIFLLVLLTLPLAGMFAQRGSPIAVIYVIVLALIVTFIGMMWVLVAEMAFVSVALENASVGFALRMAMKRTLAKAMFWRSALTALSFTAITVIASLVLGAIGGSLDALLHTGLFEATLTPIGQVLLEALTTCYLVVYYFDVRVRHEGYDLFLATQVLEPA